LPIKEALPALAKALADRRSVLLEAPPGAGKSTVVPLFLLDSPWLERQKILMLEPRRIAARAVAGRMAHLLGEPVGRSVGFRTRLETCVSRETRIEVVTEGILTRMLQDDSGLADVGCVIFDEFHERSLNADLGLALGLETQRNLREDLRLIVMSATLDLQPIAKLLGDAPVVAARGRSFDVATEYVARRPEIHLETQVAQVVRMVLRKHEGDILCFLPGTAEIRRVQQALEEPGVDRNVRIFPLYGDLTGAAQDAALSPAPTGQRKIVLATSIAETSLTIEGIRVVVDSGLRRYAEFDPTTGMSHLVTHKVSQAAADQRRGRAGRLSIGHCYRLWSEGTQASLAAQSAPEILHADLAPLALELSCWGALDASSLSWLDPPPAAPLAQARDLLRQLEAIDPAGRATPHGRDLAKLGTHPRLAHMLVRAREHGVYPLACDLAAILGERDILRASAGARDADLRLRVAVLRGDARDLPPGISLDSRAKAQAARSAANWMRNFARARTDLAGPSVSADPHESTGLLLAWAYPDRVGRARGDGGRYLLANGRGARFAEPQALSKAEFIVAAELDGAEREARIFLAAPLRLADLEEHFSAHIFDHAEVFWDNREHAIRARRERRLGALVLDSAEMRDPDPQAMQAALFIGLRHLGIAGLPWTPELRQWQARVMLMRQYAVPTPAPWPDLSDAALAASLEEWVTPWITGFTRREHFSRLDMGHALRGRLTSVAAGRLPLLLKLLSPARRPVQITRDLVSFWNRGYHEVKKDLKGRYPKHYWPEDPYAAEPTRRARPRPPSR
jgi:ATP-dependent helicase HrpB